ncbi:HDIG domain-containing protein, partial [bacterium]|nr:HDIG domain-containing protein [bacterium]
PLLKTLASNAPGTFSHTMRVAELSEAAAQAINANHILARVAALYHDIGKVNKASYFVENFRFHERNPHDKLNPNMSKTIILAHVKEGIEIAEEFGLPSSIIDAIKQHQGTGLITVFHQKAQELAKEKDETVIEGDFRYPGPKPQNKEMAIIMLADGIEAASRTLMEPTPSSIKTFVDKMFERVIMDGQLDECTLTLLEIAKIRKVFIQKITTAFHHRLDYPGVVFEGKKKHEKSDDIKQSENSKVQPITDKENGTNDFENDGG